MSHRSTRETIVEAADDLFYRQGFEHTSFSDIAERVQISRGNFYYHFKSKDEILEKSLLASPWAVWFSLASSLLSVPTGQP